jgi:hypothetical protein
VQAGPTNDANGRKAVKTADKGDEEKQVGGDGTASCRHLVAKQSMLLSRQTTSMRGQWACCVSSSTGRFIGNMHGLLHMAMPLLVTVPYNRACSPSLAEHSMRLAHDPGHTPPPPPPHTQMHTHTHTHTHTYTHTHKHVHTHMHMRHAHDHTQRLRRAEDELRDPKNFVE